MHRLRIGTSERGLEVKFRADRGPEGGGGGRMPTYGFHLGHAVDVGEAVKVRKHFVQNPHGLDGTESRHLGGEAHDVTKKNGRFFVIVGNDFGAGGLEARHD